MAVVNEYKFYGKTTTSAESVDMLEPGVNETVIVRSLRVTNKSDWWNSRKTWSGDDEDNEIILSNFQRNPETGKYEYVKRENPEYYNDLDNEFALGTISDPYSMTVGTTTPINTVDGILNTDAFANNRKNFNINNANLYQTTDDGQMYIDEEIASRRFP